MNAILRPWDEKDAEISSMEMEALMGSWASGTIVMVMWGFADESGEHDEDGHLKRLTLGGFFAPWENVKKLCEQWRAALKAENLGEFHMKEIASDEHDYFNWPKDRRDRLDRFTDILCEHAVEFFAFNYSASECRPPFKDAYVQGSGA